MDDLGYQNSGLANFKDNDTCAAMLDKMQRIKEERRIQPLQYIDYIPYKHRAFYDGFNLQLGDCYFMIPPEFIMVSAEAPTESIVTLRQENTQKSKIGHHKRVILIDLVFNGIDQLNGFKVPAPHISETNYDNNGYYYVDGLRPLLAQFKMTPILPIRNELINGMYGIYCVALQSITMSTMDGFPNAMTAQITLQEVCMFPYIEMPDICFQYMIDWDLFRYYYQRMLTEDHLYKRLQSLPANKERNRFRMSILDNSIFVDSRMQDFTISDNGKKPTTTPNGTDSDYVNEYNIMKVITDEVIIRKNADGTDSDTNYITWIDSDDMDCVISSFQCGYSNLLTNIQLEDQSAPTVQFLGGMDTIFNITFETKDYNVVQALEQCQIVNDLITRNNRRLNAAFGFVKIESELVEFCGSQFVMIESLNTNTVPGFPGLYNVQINCVAFDITQSEREELNGFKPFPCSNKECVDNSFNQTHVHDDQAIEQTWTGLKRKIKQDNYAEWKLRTGIEVYPDLHLPKYGEVDNAISAIRAFRSANSMTQLEYSSYPTQPVCLVSGLNPYGNNISVSLSSDNIVYPKNISNLNKAEYDIYVDPDFYVFYPDSYVSFSQIMDGYYDNLVTPPQREGYSKSKTTVSFPQYTPDSVVSGGGGNTQGFVNLARSFIGHTYVWGAEGEVSDSKGKCFDCSGLVYYCLKQCGVNVPYRFCVSNIPSLTSVFQEIPWNQRQYGDILTNNSYSHVVISEGNGKIVHASNSKPYPQGGVKESNEYFVGHAYRIIGLNSTSVGDMGQDDTRQDDGTTSESGSLVDKDLKNFAPITEAELNAWMDKHCRSDSPFRGNAKIFIDASKQSGLDPRYILAHAMLESSHGTSDIARDKNNYFGIGAFDASPYKSAYSFGSGLAAGIIGGAKWISEHYYRGKWKQTTLRKMRWNNNVHQYATDPKWDTKIANIMSTMPNVYKNGDGSNINPQSNPENALTMSEFNQICNAICEATQGEGSDAELAMAQVIYDRLTISDNRFGGLANILNNSNGGLNGMATVQKTTTIENNVRKVFCSNSKYWPDKTALYFLTPDSPNATYKQRDQEYDRLGEVGRHTYWGRSQKGSDIKFEIVTDSQNQGVGPATSNTQSVTTDVPHMPFNCDDIDRFGMPIMVQTSSVMKRDDGNHPFKNTVKQHWQDDVNSEENMVYTAFVNDHQYSARARFVRAFPAFLFCVLDDQAQWYDGRKLWTNYYTHRSLVDIQVHETNDMPMATATIVVNNSYNNLSRTQGGLTAYDVKNDYDYNQLQRWYYKWTGNILGCGPKLTKLLIQLHQVIYAHARLREGARVHLRMGYGSDPMGLAVAINGHVSDVQLGNQISLVVTSDGHELVSNVTSAASANKGKNNGFLGLFGLGADQEPSNIIAEYLCKRQSWMSHLSTQWGEPSKFAIEHFGLFFASKLNDGQGMEFPSYDHEGLPPDWHTISLDDPSCFYYELPDFLGKGVFGAVIEGVVNAVGYAWNFLSGLVDGLIQIRTSNYFEWHNQYDLIKNVYKANYKKDLYHHDSGVLSFDGEKNVVFTNYNMTPWDIFQTCVQSVPEYIMKPSYHQFDSRLYFGLPLWMEKFRYNWINGEPWEEVKTAAQCHYLDSLTNIIDDQVKVTSRFSSTNIKVMYQRGSSAVTTQVIHSDDTIDYDKQKTKILDTPIVQDALGPDALYELLQYKVGDASARRTGISNLLIGWQQQYQGNLICMGMPGIYAHDYLLVNDMISNLFGVCVVREVVHSFSVNTGFTTSITPGLVGFSTDENSGMIERTQSLLTICSLWSAYTSQRRGLRNAYEANLNLFNALSDAHFKLSFWEGSGLYWTGGIVGTGTALLNAVMIGKDIYHLVRTIQYVKEAGTTLKEMATIMKTAMQLKNVSTIVHGTTSLAGIIETIEVGSAAIAPETLGASLIVTVVCFIVSAILDAFFEWLSNKHTVVLLPMWWDNYPFVSGVQGGEKILLIQANARATDENDGSDPVALNPDAEYND